MIERSPVRLPAVASPGIAYVNSAFHPSGVGKSSTRLRAGVKGRDAFTWVVIRFSKY